MERTRKDIRYEMSKIKEQIKSLQLVYDELQKEDHLLCDDEQNYKEVEMDIVICYQTMNIETEVWGIIEWFEEMKDAKTGAPFFIQKSQVVRKNGVWL